MAARVLGSLPLKLHFSQEQGSVRMMKERKGATTKAEERQEALMT